MLDQWGVKLTRSEAFPQDFAEEPSCQNTKQIEDKPVSDEQWKEWNKKKLELLWERNKKKKELLLKRERRARLKERLKSNSC